MAVLLETTMGDLVVDLYTEERPRDDDPVLKLQRLVKLVASTSLKPQHMISVSPAVLKNRL